MSDPGGEPQAEALFVVVHVVDWKDALTNIGLPIDPGNGSIGFLFAFSDMELAQAFVDSVGTATTIMRLERCRDASRE